MQLSETDCVPSIYHKESSNESSMCVKVLTSERNVRSAACVGLRQQSLQNVDRCRRECIGRGSHVEPPHPKRMRAYQGCRILGFFLERFHPVPQRHRVVLSQTL